MKRATPGFVALAVLIGMASPAQAVLIDFDNLPGGGSLATLSVLKEQYASLGVHFSAFEDGVEVDSQVLDIAPFSGNYWGNTGNEFQGEAHDVLRIEFDSPVENVSWRTQSFGGAQIDFIANDDAGNLLEIVPGMGSWVSTSFSATNISRITAQQPFDFWGWGMDELTFDVVAAAPIPEPTTFALWGVLGGLGLIAAQRRRKRAA